MPDSVHVRYTKWNGSLHWHFDSVVVERDDHGTWLLVAPGSSYRRGDEPARRDEHGFIVLIPTDGWWSAYFNAVPRAPQRPLVYVDINTAPRWDGDTVHLVDLDLDVTLAPDGAVTLLDEDEFEAHRQLFAYPGDVVDQTRAAADQVVAAMSRHAEPFGVVGLAKVATHLGWGHGHVVTGHGAASGRTGDPRFPDGTLALQLPHFAAAGIPLADYMQATINIELPFEMTSHEPKARIEDLEWLADYPPETFEFFDAKIAVEGISYSALIYRPDPTTKPEFVQPRSVIEVLAPPIKGLTTGRPIALWLHPEQASFVT